MRKTALVSLLVVAVLALIGLASAGYDADFQKAIDYYKTRHYEEAVRAFEGYVEERPYGHAYYLMGYANYALGRHAEAAKNFKDAYLVDPEFSPGQFRKDVGIDRPISAKPKKEAAPTAPGAPAEVEKPAPVEAAPAAPEAPAVAAKPAPKAAPAARKAPEKAPVVKPRPRPIPAPTMPAAAPMAFLVALGLIPLVIGLVFYVYFSLCLFLIAKKTDVKAPLTAFIPILQVWPLVGAAGKPVWWIVLLIVPVVNIIVTIYLWMLIAERLGKNKFLGLLMLVPVVNLVFLGLLAFKRRAAAAAAAGAGFELPDIPDEFPSFEDFEEGSEEEASPKEEPPPEELFREASPVEAPAEEAFGAAEGAAAFEEAASEGAFKGAPGGEPLEYEAGEEEFDEFPAVPAGAGIIGVGDLFKNTFEIYKKRLILLLILLAAYVFAGVAFGIFFGIGMLLGIAVESLRAGFIAGGTVVGAIAAVITGFWGQGAFVFAVADERLGFKDAYRRAWQKLGSFVWISLLMGYIVVGGFLMFIIPGVLFGVWFTFCLFVLAKEDLRGMTALLKSKEYVKGLWGPVFVRLLLVWIVSIGLSLVPFIGWLLSLLYTPFMMIFVYLIYEDMRGLKGEVVYSTSTGTKAKWLALGTLGYMVAPIVIIALTGATVLASLMMFKVQF